MEKELFIDIEHIEMRNLSSFENNSEVNLENKISDMGCYFSLFKGMVAMGILYLPFGFSLGGIAYSIATLLFSGTLTFMGYTRIIKTSSKLNTDFSGIALYSMGTKGKLLIDVTLTVLQISILLNYLIYITNSILDLTNHFEFNVSETTIFFLQTLLLSALFIPLTLKESISWLTPFHFFADFIIIIFSLVISGCLIILIFRNKKIGEGITPINYKGMLTFFGMSILAFEGIGTILPIYKSMKNPKHFTKILAKTLIIIFILYNIIGLIGYLTFGSNIPDIQINYVLLKYAPYHSTIYYITFVFTHIYMLNLIPSFVLNANPPFRIIDKAILNLVKNSKSSRILQIILTSIILIIIIISGIFLRNRGGEIISIIGSILGASLGFIFPGIFSLRILSLTKYEKFKDYLLIFVGVIAAIVGSINSILL